MSKFLVRFSLTSTHCDDIIILPKGGESVYVKRIVLSLFFVLLIFSIIYFFIPQNEKIIPKKINLDNINLYQENSTFIQNDIWTLTIEKINLINVPIKDSVEEDILENYIGHFPISSYYNGNVCLAAHNSGFFINYFKDLNTLEYNDEIKYNYYGNIKVYKVTEKYIVDEEDLNVLAVDFKDKMTLITCITGSPSKRLCIEAISKE